MTMITIHPEITVALLLKKWPQVISVMIRHRMACVGCSLARFETLSDAAAVYSIPFEAFHQELLAAIHGEVSSSNPSLSEE